MTDVNQFLHTSLLAEKNIERSAGISHSRPEKVIHYISLTVSTCHCLPLLSIMLQTFCGVLFNLFSYFFD